MKTRHQLNFSVYLPTYLGTQLHPVKYKIHGYISLSRDEIRIKASIRSFLQFHSKFQ